MHGLLHQITYKYLYTAQDVLKKVEISLHCPHKYVPIVCASGQIPFSRWQGMAFVYCRAVNVFMYKLYNYNITGDIYLPGQRNTVEGVFSLCSIDDYLQIKMKVYLL